MRIFSFLYTLRLFKSSERHPVCKCSLASPDPVRFISVSFQGKHLGRNKKGLTPSQVEAIGEWQKAVKATSALQDKIIHLIELERSGEEEETTDEIWIDSDGQLQIRWRKESAKKSRFFSTRIDRKVNRVGWPWLPKGVTVSEERKAAVMEEAFREMRDVYEDLQRELARSAAEAESLRRASLETWTREGGQSGDDDKR